MDKEGALAALSILVLSGVLVFAYRSATAAKASGVVQAGYNYEAQAAQNVIQDEILLMGSANAYNSGAAIYVANTPYLFQTPMGNTIPSSAISNVPFATAADAGNLQSIG